MYSQGKNCIFLGLFFWTKYFQDSGANGNKDAPEAD